MTECSDTQVAPKSGEKNCCPVNDPLNFNEGIFRLRIGVSRLFSNGIICILLQENEIITQRTDLHRRTRLLLIRDHLRLPESFRSFSSDFSLGRAFSSTVIDNLPPQLCAPVNDYPMGVVSGVLRRDVRRLFRRRLMEIRDRNCRVDRLYLCRIYCVSGLLSSHLRICSRKFFIR